MPPTTWIKVNEGFEDEWPGSSALATECVLNLFAVVAVMERTVAKWGRAFDIPSVAALNLLEILRGEGAALPPSIIAERMLVTRGAVSQVVQSLQSRGLVRRRPHPHDARMTLVEITATGQDRLERFVVQLHRVDKRIMSVLGDQQKREFLQMLADIRAHLPTGTLAQAAGEHPAHHSSFTEPRTTGTSVAEADPDQLHVVSKARTSPGPEGK